MPRFLSMLDLCTKWYGRFRLPTFTVFTWAIHHNQPLKSYYYCHSTLRIYAYSWGVRLFYLQW